MGNTKVDIGNGRVELSVVLLDGVHRSRVESHHNTSISYLVISNRLISKFHHVITHKTMHLDKTKADKPRHVRHRIQSVTEIKGLINRQ